MLGAGSLNPEFLLFNASYNAKLHPLQLMLEKINCIQQTLKNKHKLAS